MPVGPYLDCKWTPPASHAACRMHWAGSSAPGWGAHAVPAHAPPPLFPGLCMQLMVLMSDGGALIELLRCSCRRMTVSGDREGTHAEADGRGGGVLLIGSLGGRPMQHHTCNLPASPTYTCGPPPLACMHAGMHASMRAGGRARTGGKGQRLLVSPGGGLRMPRFKLVHALLKCVQRSPQLGRGFGIDVLDALCRSMPITALRAEPSSWTGSLRPGQEVQSRQTLVGHT